MAIYKLFGDDPSESKNSSEEIIEIETPQEKKSKFLQKILAFIRKHIFIRALFLFMLWGGWIWMFLNLFILGIYLLCWALALYSKEEFLDKTYQYILFLKWSCVLSLGMLVAVIHPLSGLAILSNYFMMHLESRLDPIKYEELREKLNRLMRAFK